MNNMANKIILAKNLIFSQSKWQNYLNYPLNKVNCFAMAKKLIVFSSLYHVTEFYSMSKSERLTYTYLYCEKFFYAKEMGFIDFYFYKSSSEVS